ncbi:MAG: YbaK/EbsC family protein [Kiloniellales bacterium]|nr:YbaK/EbsC family protein [Kiloniellales bacterium]
MPETPPPKGSLRRVQEALAAKGLETAVTTFPESTRTSAEAAAAIGCSVGQIAKSLVFRGRESDRPVLVIASGDNRVDTGKVAAVLGEKIARADADFVRARTGFAIGGVAPVAHKEPPLVVIDRDLLAHDRIWAAAGAPNAVFELAPRDLEALTGGPVAEIRQD